MSYAQQDDLLFEFSLFEPFSYGISCGKKVANVFKPTTADLDH